jgi:predicted transcriptional regulator
MNPTQKRILESRLLKSGREFTCRQMAEHLDMKPTTVMQMLNTLAQSGVLRDRPDPDGGMSPETLYHHPLLVPLVVRRPWTRGLCQAITETLEQARA